MPPLHGDAKERPVSKEAVDVLAQVRTRLEERHLSLPEAARAIGVTSTALRHHLGGGYVRSDSRAKYRAWLAGPATRAPGMPRREASLAAPAPPRPPLFDGDPPSGRLLVVDLFSGCGGLSLGFEAFEDYRFPGDGPIFETVLAVDNEEPMVRAFNANRRAIHQPACQQVDLRGFLDASEVLAWYLYQLAAREADVDLHLALGRLPGMPLDRLREWLLGIDSRFLAEVAAVRHGVAWREAFATLPHGVLGQTSVVAFHADLGLPMTSQASPRLAPAPWAGDYEGSDEGAPGWLRAGDLELVEEACSVQAAADWIRAAQALEGRQRSEGSGQIRSSAGRIRSFLGFLASGPMKEVRSAWVRWRARRDAVRQLYFGQPGMAEALEALRTPDRQVSVLLGGPPCQGFSRMNRGKLRNLRRQGVHSRDDAEVGDVRNRLLYKYVLFVAALRPRVFLFENVRHFASRLDTPEGTFDAPALLAGAIRDLDGGLEYRMSTRVVDASQHLVPQRRERFMMVGVRADVADAIAADAGVDAAAWCLALPVREPVTLAEAFTGLPVPHVGGKLEQSVETEGLMLHGPGRAVDEYLRWIYLDEAERIDAHVTRPVRADDAALFGLFGPGRRWMDYRCDAAPTLREIADLLGSLRDLPGADRARIDAVLGKADGALALRLLLESIAPCPGEEGHHLLADTYMTRQDGRYGDWLERLDPARPAKTVVSHLGKDAYGFVHPAAARTLSVREAARLQSFPDSFRFGCLSMVDAYRVIGNAVPPLLACQLAGRVAQVLWRAEAAGVRAAPPTGTEGE